MSWNGCPSFTRNSIVKQLKAFPKKAEKEKDDRKIIWIRLPYLGNIDDSMKKNCFKKVQKCLKENVCFIKLFLMKQKKQQCFVQLRIAFQYTKKQMSSTKSLVLVLMNITLEKLIAI